MSYTKLRPVLGLGKIERENLSSLLRETNVTISVAEAERILNVTRQRAGKLLSQYANKGWLSRISRGIYIPVPLDSETADITLEDELAVATKLFAPCYIGGWTAAETWGLTEQIFQSVVVITQQPQANYSPTIINTKYLLHLRSPDLFFGLKTQWRNNVKVSVSDPTRTIIDVINNPALGGGIRHSTDILKNYFASNEKSTALLIEYLKKLGNGAAYKRFGFLIEKLFPSEMEIINECRNNLSSGNAKLDASLDCDKLATKWRLWVPSNWKE